MSSNSSAPFDLAPIVADVRRAAAGRGSLWLVGGAVRDALLRRSGHDLDFVVQGDALAAGRAVANGLHGAYYPLDAERGVGRVLADHDGQRYTLDFAGLRGDSLEADLAKRDFTVNAMAISLDEPEALLDPLEGEHDLRAKLIRECGPEAIASDPVRGIRAVRLAAQLNFRLDKLTRKHIREQAQAVGRVSPERRRDEFIRCLGGRRPAGALRALDALGLLAGVIPQLAELKGVTQSAPHAYNVWEHTLAAVGRLHDVLSVLGRVHDVDAASELTLGLAAVRLGRHRQALDDHFRIQQSGERERRWLLMLAALLHDIGKPTTRSVDQDGRIRFIGHDQVGADMALDCMTALHFSNEESRHVQTIVAHHLRPLLLAHEPQISRRAIYRLFRDTGPAGVDIVLLSMADFLATHADGPPPTADWNRLLEVASALLQAFFEEPATTVNPIPLLAGDDLMRELGLSPGPRIGEILGAIREAQASGLIPDRDAALEFARQHLAE